ncbi:MAG: 4-hydroxybenzoyl-CoA reductase subunit beta [bacterium]|nr:4-hydroxybenzoyl-CoA reductase subunit beta [bacterium]
MRLPPFHLHRPTSVSDAVALAATYGDSAQFIAGGTDLLQHLKNRIYTPDHVISLQHLPGLRDITLTRIGALATLADIATHPSIGEQLPALVECIEVIASPVIRSTATLGGNLLVDTRCYYVNQSYEWRLSKGACLKSEGQDCLVVPNPDTCYATFSADTPALLMCWDASVHLAGPDGERDVPLTAFYQYDGIARHVKQPGEIITWVDIPAEAQTLTSGYSKLRVRDAFDYPELGVAAALSLHPDGTLAALRLAFCAVDAVPNRIDDAVASLLGQPLTDEAIAQVCAALPEKLQPYRNTALPPGYRRQMTAVFARRLLVRLRDQARQQPEA